jgi:hypothetical protein
VRGRSIIGINDGLKSHVGRAGAWVEGIQDIRVR